VKGGANHGKRSLKDKSIAGQKRNNAKKSLQKEALQRDQAK
jgi:hypothetical protein